MCLQSNISPEGGKLRPSKLEVLNHLPRYKSTIAIVKTVGIDFKKKAFFGTVYDYQPHGLFYGVSICRDENNGQVEFRSQTTSFHFLNGYQAPLIVFADLQVQRSRFGVFRLEKVQKISFFGLCDKNVVNMCPLLCQQLHLNMHIQAV